MPICFRMTVPRRSYTPSSDILSMQNTPVIIFPIVHQVFFQSRELQSKLRLKVAIKNMLQVNMNANNGNSIIHINIIRMHGSLVLIYTKKLIKRLMNALKFVITIRIAWLSRSTHFMMQVTM
jgi:hypothetical protein